LIADLKRQAIYKWLAAPDPYMNHVTNRKKRQAQTGVWLLRSKQYEHWLQSEKSFLWIYGIRELSSTRVLIASDEMRQLEAARRFFGKLLIILPNSLSLPAR